MYRVNKEQAVDCSRLTDQRRERTFVPLSGKNPEDEPLTGASQRQA